HHFDDIIEEIESNNGSNDRDIVEMPDVEYPSMEPIVIRGNGNMTLFGLSNTFSADFPSSLIGRVSREEFETTIGRVNNLLRQHHSTNAKLLLLGCLCCCCSFGCSLLWPTLALSKRTRNALEKLLASENHKLYHKLGLNWKLSKERCHSNHAFMEYVLLIEFLPKLHLYQPD
ncbi:cysteine-rich hydrophobic domain 2-like protein, partial [Dinothrombium tinctorium]